MGSNPASAERGRSLIHTSHRRARDGRSRRRGRIEILKIFIRTLSLAHDTPSTPEVEKRWQTSLWLWLSFVATGCAEEGHALGRALLLHLLLLCAHSSSVLATGLSDDFVPCAVVGDGDAYGSVEPHVNFSGGFRVGSP